MRLGITTRTAFKGLLQSKSKTGRLTLSQYNFSGKRILLAEDQTLNVEVAEMVLQGRGMVVEHAENGEEAVKKFKDAAPYYYDAIIMDIRMPIMDGLQATFECAHALKGVAGNLGLIVLHEQVAVIVEKCRYVSHAGIERDYKKLCNQFAAVKAVVDML